MTSLLRVKLRRDLWAARSRFLLMVVAISISLTVFGGVLAAWATMSRETEAAYLSTEPASATILLDEGVDAEQMAAIATEAKRRPGVIEATARTQFTSDIQVNGRLRLIPVQVFAAAAADPLRMARFFPEGGIWPPSPNEIFIGRDSLGLLGVAIGDTVTVETPSGESLRLRMADTVYDPSLAPSGQEQTGRAYVSTASLAPSGGQALLDQLKIQVADPGQTVSSRDRGAVVAVAGDVGEWLQEEYGLTVREVQVPQPYAHPHQGQADALLLSLVAGGAAALLLGSILVATMLNNLFTQQIPQIGIMKAIGARAGRIGRLYLAMTVLVAGTATLLALWPATWIGRGLAGQAFGFLGIEPAGLAPEWWTYVVIVAVGLGVPALMALVPLVKASRTTVRAAINHHGAGSKPSAASGVLARLSRIRRLDRGLLLALRNTVRRPARFLLSVGLLASAGTVFVAGMSLSSGTEAIAEEQKEQRTWDVDVQLTSPVSMDRVDAVVEGVPDVSRVEGFNVAQAGLAGPGRIPVTRTYPDQGHGRVSVIAVPSGSTMFRTPELLEGRWLNEGEKGAIVLNQITRNNTLPDASPGDPVQLVVGGTRTTLRVVGIVQERGGGAAAYATADGFAAAIDQPQRVNELRVATQRHDEGTRQAVAEDVEAALTDAGIQVQSAASVSRSEAITAGHLGPIVTIVLAIAVAMGVIGGIGLASTMSANILDRTREFGVMHAIGARPKAVRRIVVAEGIFLAITSLLVAVIPALGLTAILGAGLGNLFMDAPLPFRVSMLAVGIWLALALLGGALATDAAATRASRITVREALAYL